MSMINTGSRFQEQEQEHARMEEIARKEMIRQSIVGAYMGEPYTGLTNHSGQAFTANSTSRYDYNNKEIELNKDGVRIDERRGSTRVRILSEERDPVAEFNVYENFEPKAIAEIAKYRYISILKGKEITVLKRKAKIWDIKV